MEDKEILAQINKWKQEYPEDAIQIARYKLVRIDGDIAWEMEDSIEVQIGYALEGR